MLWIQARLALFVIHQGWLPKCALHGAFHDLIFYSNILCASLSIVHYVDRLLCKNQEKTRLCWWDAVCTPFHRLPFNTCGIKNMRLDSKIDIWNGVEYVSHSLEMGYRSYESKKYLYWIHAWSDRTHIQFL